MPQELEWKELSKRLNALFAKPESKPEKEDIKNALGNESAVNIALAMEELKPEQAVVVFETLDKQTGADVLAKLDPEYTKIVATKLHPEELKGLIEPLPPREAAGVLVEVSSRQLHTYLNNNVADPSAVHDTQRRLNYPKGSAGRLMTTQFVRLHSDVTVADAIEVVRHTDPKVDIPEDLYVIDRDTSTKPVKNHLLGVV